MPEPAPTAAQQAAAAQARLLARELALHRQSMQALAATRPGICLADGWEVSATALDGDFLLDPPLVEHVLGGPLSAAPAGPFWRAAPAPSSGGGEASPEAGSIGSYLFPDDPPAPPRTAGRLGQELAQGVYGPANVLANSGAAVAGAVQGLGERAGARALRDGMLDIVQRRAAQVVVGPDMVLYNAAGPGFRPRVRLRVRSLPLHVLQQRVPATGGPVTQWRMNGPQTAASLKASSMTAQQLRNTAILAGERRLPGWLRLASGKVGGGVLTFAPSLALDAWASIETDLRTGRRSFDVETYLRASARSQSGNVVGFGAAVIVGASVGAASAPVVFAALAFGIAAQVLWNWAGGADMAEAAAARALR